MTDETRAEGEALGTRVGELRRLTIMFADVVGSTELSGREEPEAYREVIRGYHNACREVIEDRYDGHVIELQGDGTLAAFGYPAAHENDAERAVRAGLALVVAVREATGLAVRVGVHHGPLYLDFDDEDIYGLTANVGARLHALADPGTVVISDSVRQLVAAHFEVEAGEPQLVKGVDTPLQPFRVVRERSTPAPRSWATRMVEREDALDRLRRAWRQAADGVAERTATVLIHGEAGIGKSRLAAALADEARAEGAPVIELHGSPFHEDVGFHPVRVLVERRCGIGGETSGPERLACLTADLESLGIDPAATVPLLAPVLGIESRAGYEQAASEGRKLEEQVADAVRGYVLACTGERPAVVLAENVHWFDEATRILLDELRSGPGRVLLVATSRDPEVGRWERIELAPLTAAGRRALIDLLDPDLSELHGIELASRSGGVPLFLEELVRAGPSALSPAHAATLVPGSVPAILYEPLVARLYSTPAALPVAATAAAAGQEVDSGLLARTMAMPALDVEATVATLVDARVLEPVAGRDDRYRFRHELLREVAYELQPPSWRRRVHDRLCDLLSREDPSDWHVLASHFERAERFEEAADAYRRTAEWARRRGALDEARGHLTRAIDLVAAVDAGPERDGREVELRLQRGFLAMSAEGAASIDAAADFERCRALGEADPGDERRSRTLVPVWAYYLARGELQAARGASESLRAAIGGRPGTLRPQNDASFGMLDWFEGRFDRASEELSDALGQLATQSADAYVRRHWFVPNDATAAMHVHHALARFMAADLAGAEESLERAEARAAGLDFPQGPWSSAYAAWLGSWMWAEAGAFDRAARAAEELTEASARHGFAGWELVGATQVSAVEALRTLHSGTAGADVLAEHGEEVGAQADVWAMIEFRLLLPYYLTTAGALLQAAGDTDGARARFDESLQLAAGTGMGFYDAETRRLLARLEPTLDAVAAGLREALALARAQAARPFELRIALDLQAMLGDEALADIELARARTPPAR